MTTEDDFQRALDKSSEDWQTRLVFADWLQERDDPRAEGMRALGAMRLIPILPPLVTRPGFNNRRNLVRHLSSKESEIFRRSVLPDDWFDEALQYSIEPSWSEWIVGHNRSEVEDAAAFAFAKLPAERRAELLRGIK